MANKTLSEHPNPSNEEAPRLALEVCPYWSAAARACQLVTEGLFLPVPQHVVVYCVSNNHSSCAQYQKYVTPAPTAQKTENLPINRRRSLRIASCHNFRFSELTTPERSLSPSDNEAWTIDLSDHGIRFATRQRLQPNTLILFSLKAGDTIGAFEGTGRVVWSEPFENTNLFSVGIAFAANPTTPVAAAPH